MMLKTKPFRNKFRFSNVGKMRYHFLWSVNVHPFLIKQQLVPLTVVYHEIFNLNRKLLVKLAEISYLKLSSHFKNIFLRNFPQLLGEKSFCWDVNFSNVPLYLYKHTYIVSSTSFQSNIFCCSCYALLHFIICFCLFFCIVVIVSFYNGNITSRNS